MKTKFLIAFFLGSLSAKTCIAENRLNFDFYGAPVSLSWDNSLAISLDESKDDKAILTFYQAISSMSYTSLVNDLLATREKYRLDDWLFYQLIRKTAQLVSPKAENYYRYTLYKWFLLTRTGYSATLKKSSGKLLFYVQSDENIYNIPFYLRNGKQYVCLNFHDYDSQIDFEKETFHEVLVAEQQPQKVFSYKVTRLPDFTPADYLEKDIQFNYNDNTYHFKIKLTGRSRPFLPITR
jgi:hypothetical protein